PRPAGAGVPRGWPCGRGTLPPAVLSDLEGDDHPAWPRARICPAEAAGRANLDVRALDRDADHGLAGGACRREPVPGYVVDGAVIRPAERDQLGGQLRCALRDGPDEAHRPGPTRAIPAG